MAQALCPHCGDLFKSRSNKKFCSQKCQKSHHRLIMRKQTPESKNNMLPTELRRNLELRHLNLVLSEKVYQMPIGERLGYVESVLQVVRSESGGLLRFLLQNQKYQYPDPKDLGLFFRSSPKAYKSFPQLCNHYLLNSPWNCYLTDFLKGVPDPSTGEVLSDGTIDIRQGAQGWKPAVAGHRKRKAKGNLKRVSKGPVYDPTERYINDWYYDGKEHREGRKSALIALNARNAQNALNALIALNAFKAA